MWRFPPFLFFLTLSLTGCSTESADGTGVGSNDAFCGPAMVRVDSFMATFAGQTRVYAEPVAPPEAPRCTGVPIQRPPWSTATHMAPTRLT